MSFYNVINRNYSTDIMEMFVDMMLLDSDLVFFNDVFDVLRNSVTDNMYYSNIVNYRLHNDSEIEYRERIKDLFIQDKYKLFNYILCGNNSSVYYYGFSLYDDEDIIDVLCNVRDYNNFVLYLNHYSNKFILDRVLYVISRYSNNLIHNDFNRFIKLLKGLRSDDCVLFRHCLHSVVLDDNLLDKLYKNRGLSDLQKKIIFNENKNRLINIISKNILNDKSNALDYLQKGTSKEILDIVLDNISKDELFKLLNDKSFVDRKSVGNDFACKLLLKVCDDKDNKLLNDYLNTYTKDKIKLVKNYEKINYFLDYCKINKDEFYQYSLNSSYDFIDDVVNILNGNIEKFVKFKNVYEKSFIKSKVNSIDFINVIRNYGNYTELCNDIVKHDNIDEKDIKNIMYLFNRNEIVSVKPRSISESRNIFSVIKKDLEKTFKKCSSIDDYRDFIFESLFNCDTKEIINKLNIYGSTSDLIELKYYNRNNKRVVELIDEIILYTSMIEDILNCNDIDSLRNTSKAIIDNCDIILIDNNYSMYDEKMKEIYALDTKSNLTKINSKNKDKVFDIHKSMKYGVESYDFSDKKYALLTHVKSDRESIEDLINGKSNGDMNFISLSSISHRNQSYYYGAHNIIFGYDDIPEENFVYSSSSNMASNKKIRNNSIEVEQIKRHQRGIYEISDTDGNSEVLCLREGIKPKYIVIPDGREATYEEIMVAKKYNLKLCFTQGKDQMIKNPKEIEDSKPFYDGFSRDELIKMKNELNTVSNGKRKIGILTDVHGLIEPTIAILEDMRKNGITEIYSLGDNIGSGPNPSEVMDLLKAYGVKSIKGNHELYMSGLKDYEKHLNKSGSFKEESINRQWTLDHLRKDQIDDIETFGDHIVLNIKGKKILLCHYLYDYNNDTERFNPKDYDLVLQGHYHFRDRDENVITLKAAGIGNYDNDVGKASYTIIEENDNSVDIKERRVDFNYRNTFDNINLSDINTKKKMLKWVGNSNVRY